MKPWRFHQVNREDEDLPCRSGRSKQYRQQKAVKHPFCKQDGYIIPFAY